MSGDSRIISFGGAPTDGAKPHSHGTEDPPLRDAIGAPASTEDAPTSDWDNAWVSGSDPHEEIAHWDEPATRSWIAPVLAGLAGLGWSAFFIATHLPQWRAGIELVQVPPLVMQWCVPLLLIGMIWLLALRHSAREGKRFGDVARALSVESALLEQRLASVNRELSLAREFVASQARDLESLGRLATERLSSNAQRLQDLVQENSTRVETISTVSTTALDNMEKLRGQLPVIASSAKDVSNNIANAGRTAHSQIEDMINGFHRLNEFGLASERQVTALRTAVDAALSQFAGQCEDLEVLARERFTALTEQSAQFRTELDQHEVDALASIRTRATALRDELDASRQTLDENEAQSLTSLRARLNALREECGVVSRAIGEAQGRASDELREGFAALSREHEESRSRLVANHESILADLSQRLSALDGASGMAQERVANAQQAVIASFEERLAALSNQTKQTQMRISEAQSATLASFEGQLAGILAQADKAQDDARMRDERLATETQERQVRQAEQERHAVARIEQMLAELDDAIAERLERHRHQAEILTERAREVSSQLEHFDARLRSIATQSGESEARLTSSLTTLADQLAASRASLAATDGDVVKLTDDSVRLLELLQASSRQAHGELPEAISVSEGRLSRLDESIAKVLSLLGQASTEGQALAGSLDATDGSLSSLNTRLEDAQRRFGEHAEDHNQRLVSLQETLVDLEASLTNNAARAQTELTDAIQALRTSLEEAIAAIETDAPGRITAVTQSLGEASGLAIDKAMRATVSEISGQLEQAVAHASGVSREATIQLREQLEKVTELVGHLETRVAEAREQASEQVNNDFARRAALITESLNSNAIDISAALSHEVSDTAWASYLRGDRGIFTRRTVNLIDSSDAKAIQQTYERDDAFREHVNRYVHDFESLLRQVLSTRDGNAMGVTLLSSDMGKLYVALAQGIERLRS